MGSGGPYNFDIVVARTAQRGRIIGTERPPSYPGQLVSQIRIKSSRLLDVIVGDDLRSCGSLAASVTVILADIQPRHLHRGSPLSMVIDAGFDSCWQ